MTEISFSESTILGCAEASRAFGLPNTLGGASPLHPTSFLCKERKQRNPYLLRVSVKNIMKTRGNLLRKRDKKLSFWVTESERNKIKKIAAKTGMKDGEDLLMSALGKTIYQVEELKPMLHELKAIGRNLNQLTTLAHSGRLQVVNLNGTAACLHRNYLAINRLFDECDGVIANGSTEESDGNL